MKALVYHVPQNKSWDEKPMPTIIDPTDAVVKISKTSICGPVLHILKGDVSEVTEDCIYGKKEAALLSK